MAGRLHNMVDGEGRQVQTVVPLPDGTLRVTLEEISKLGARQRILSFGKQLVALDEPASLKAELAEEAAEIVRRLT